jgi:hypothetical protein
METKTEANRPAVAISNMKRGQKNMLTLLDSLRLGMLDVGEIGLMFNLSESSVRKYLRTAIEYGAVRENEGRNKFGLKLYEIGDEDAIAEMLLDQDRQRGKPVRTGKPRPSLSEVRKANALKEGRRFVHHGDNNDHFRPEPMRPAFRCEMENYIFGPAKGAV